MTRTGRPMAIGPTRIVQLPAKVTERRLCVTVTRAVLTVRALPGRAGPRQDHYGT